MGIADNFHLSEKKKPPNPLKPPPITNCARQMTNAIVSLLYDTSYLPGALVLGISLRKILATTNTTDVVLGLIIDFSRFSDHQLSLLTQVYDELIEATVFTSSLVDKLTYDLKRPELNKTFTKIQLWSLSHYEKVLYLDSDTLPTVPSSPGQGSVVDLLSLEFPENKILAAPDSGFPDIFNSGVFVLKPNPTDFGNLVNIASSLDGNISFDGADQGLLNQYFNGQPDWVADLLAAHQVDIRTADQTRSSNWVPIPFFYNTTPSAQYEYLPAYNHFTVGPGGLGPEPFPGPVPALAPHDADDVLHQLYPTFATLDRYHASALSFFAGDRSQIKLVHFIGPVKPWSAGSAGVYAGWWDIWNEYLYGTSISDVVGGSKEIRIPFVTPQTVSAPAPESPPAPQHLPEPEPKIVRPESPPPAATLDPQINVPADLCDPQNYQHFPELQVTSEGSNWDATREPPPEEDHYHHEHKHLLDFAEEMKSFSNVWDQPEPKPEPEPQPVSEPYHQPEPQSRPGDGFEFGYHYDQPVERVFNSESDYVPSHLLILQKGTAGDEKKQVDAKSGDTSVPSEYQITSVGLDSISFNKVNERLENLALITNKHEVEEIFDDETEENLAQEVLPSAISAAPKLFPWEFRDDSKVPERVFD